MTELLKAATPCCHFCENCPKYLSTEEPTCEGCVAKNGTAHWGVCQLYACVTKRKIEHCGECTEFPCEFLIKNYNAKNPTGAVNAIFRIGQMALRKKLGTEEWIARCSEGQIPRKNTDSIK